MTRCSRTPGGLVRNKLPNEDLAPLESEIASWQSIEITFLNWTEVCS